MKMKEAMRSIIHSCKNLSDEEFSTEEENTILSSRKLISLNTATIARLSTNIRPFEIKTTSIVKSEPTTTISFKKPTRMVDIAKKQMGARTNKDVGITAFEYYFKRECDDDE